MFAAPAKGNWSKARAVLLAVALAGTGLTAFPAAAQSQDADARLRKIESEVRALQRKVFPGGEGRFFEPEVDTGATTNIGPVGPSTSAVTDILGRLDSIEAQLARLTSQVEINGNDLAMLDRRLKVFEDERNQKLAAERAAAQAKARAEAEAKAAEEAAAAAEPEPPSPERVAAVQAIAKPSSGDVADDEYVSGFRLWEAKLYPEAQQQLRLFVQKYPDHWRTSYGRNLLGRAFFDEAKYSEAVPWFVENYTKDPDGARSGDSLLFLAETMMAMKDSNRACIALATFSEKYPALATGRLQQQYETDRTKVTCK